MEEAPLRTWTRPYFQPAGGDAFLFYAVFGPAPRELAVDRSRYRCDGIPAGLTVLSYNEESSPEALESIRGGVLWDALLQRDPSLANGISRQSDCMLITGRIPDPSDLNYLRNVVGIICWLLDGGGVAVYDPQMLKWWSPEEWRQSLFEPDWATPSSHVAILAAEDGRDTEWLHTRGMRKFGRPDISIHSVPPPLRDDVMDLCNRLIRYEALGGILAEDEQATMPGLPEGMRYSHRGSPDDPEFNNVHIEILWP